MADRGASRNEKRRNFMAQCMCKMVLDVADRDGAQCIVARQGDSATRFVRLRLTSFGEPIRVEESAIAVLNVKNAANEQLAFEGEVNSDGSLTLPINRWMLQSVGVLQCDVSVIDVGGGKLTTPSFEIEVVASVTADDALPGDDMEGESLTARLLAQEKIFVLEPVLSGDGFLLQPRCNRKYALDLSGDAYASGADWKAISLVLPKPEDTASDNWILIYCHAPVRLSGSVSIDWGNASDLLFEDGAVPEITKGDLDVICTYSPSAGKWQIGVVQYEEVGGTV